MPRAPFSPKARWGVYLASGLIALLAVGYLAGIASASGNVPRGTTVAGVQIGGLSSNAAKAKLAKELGVTAAAPIQVVADGTEHAIDPTAAGLSFDIDATVAAAGRVGKSPLAVLSQLSGGRQVNPVIVVDEGKLANEVAKLAESVDVAGSDGSITFKNARPVAVAAKDGKALDQVKAIEAIRAAFLTADGPVQVPVEVSAPSVTTAEVDRAIAEVAGPAVAAKVTLNVGGTDVVVTPAQIAANLSFVADSGGKLTPKLDGKGLLSALGSSVSKLGVAPKNATFDVSSGTPKIVPGVAGTGLNADSLATAVSGVLTSAAPRTATVSLTTTPPALTSDTLSKLGIVEKVSTFTTNHPCCASRVTNIHKMADIVNGHIVLPGETFSLNGFVGERDRARGFVEAPMILDGLYVDSVGGGVSQFATTLFNAVFFAGLQDVQHKPHSYYISRYPAGRESTVSFPQPDFQFKNDSPNGVLIQATYTNTSLTVSFWGTKRYDIESISGPRTKITTTGTRYNDKPGCESASGREGFDITVWRVFKQNGKEVKRQSFNTHYLPEPHIICGPKPSTTVATTDAPPPVTQDQ